MAIALSMNTYAACGQRPAKRIVATWVGSDTNTDFEEVARNSAHKLARGADLHLIAFDGSYLNQEQNAFHSERIEAPRPTPTKVMNADEAALDRWGREVAAVAATTKKRVELVVVVSNHGTRLAKFDLPREKDDKDMFLGGWGIATSPVDASGKKIPNRKPLTPRQLYDFGKNIPPNVSLKIVAAQCGGADASADMLAGYRARKDATEDCGCFASAAAPGRSAWIPPKDKEPDWGRAFSDSAGGGGSLLAEASWAHQRVSFKDDNFGALSSERDVKGELALSLDEWKVPVPGGGAWNDETLEKNAAFVLETVKKRGAKAAPDQDFMVKSASERRRAVCLHLGLDGAACDKRIDGLRASLKQADPDAIQGAMAQLEKDHPSIAKIKDLKGAFDAVEERWNKLKDADKVGEANALMTKEVQPAYDALKKAESESESLIQQAQDSVRGEAWASRSLAQEMLEQAFVAIPTGGLSKADADEIEKEKARFAEARRCELESVSAWPEKGAEEPAAAGTH